MSSRRGKVRAPLALVVAGLLVAITSGPAGAQETSPIDDAVGDVTTQVQRAVDQVATAPPQGATDDSTTTAAADSTDAGATDPGSQARSQVAEVDLGDQAVLDVGRSEASMDDTNRSGADATLLAVGGQEIIGTHADSAGENETHAGDPLAELCQGSEGQLCLRLLFADGYATQDGTSSSSLSQTGVADACLGGDSADPRAECSGPVGAEVATSDAAMQRDTTDGSTSGQTESALADVCVAPESGTCALGIRLLWAESSASSDGSSEGASTLAALELGNEQVLSLDDSESVAVQPECAEPSALCVAANQGSAVTEDGHAVSSQDALTAGALPDTAEGAVGLSSTRVEATDEVLGEEATAGDEPDTAGSAGTDDGAIGGVGGPGNPGAGEVAGLGDLAEGVLPDTGGFWSGLLAVALAALAGGAFLIARSRRRVGAHG